MKILFDIEHPAHVHYFKNVISILKGRGHNIIITAIDKDITFQLLKQYDLSFVSLGKHYKSIFKKVFALIRNELKLIFISFKHKPDIYVSFHSPYPAHVGFLFRKKVIGITDTEHAKVSNFLTNPFSDIILTPDCFLKDLGKNHIKFNALIELSYLHPNYFKPNKDILDLLEIGKDEKYSILRFISWDAMHDRGQYGLTLEVKRKAVRELSKFGKVFISSEDKLPDDLKKYKLNIPHEMIHDALYYAALFFGESGTMATESAILGTPTVRVSTLAKLLGNFKELNDKYDLVNYFDDSNLGLSKCIEILNDKNSKNKWKDKSEKFINDKVDITKYLVDLLERQEYE